EVSRSTQRTTRLSGTSAGSEKPSASATTRRASLPIYPTQSQESEQRNDVVRHPYVSRSIRFPPTMEETFMKLARVFGLGLVLAVTTPIVAEAQGFRQYYDTSYTYSPSYNYYYVRYYYKPVVTYTNYDYHYAIYYPSYPQYIYYYNPTAQVYWGRYE